MKDNWKYILNIFILLNIIYLGLYIYDKYIKIPELNNSSNKLVSNKTNVLSNIDSLIPLEYGDLVSDHILKDVSNNSIEIYRANEQFNFIYVNKLKVPEILDIDHLLPFIEIRKNFNNDNIKLTAAE